MFEVVVQVPELGAHPGELLGLDVIERQQRLDVSLGVDPAKSVSHVMFELHDFIGRLAALVPRPRVHIIRYLGLFAPARALSPPHREPEHFGCGR